MKQINSKQTGKGLMSPLQTAASLVLVSVWALAVAGSYLVGLNIYIVLVIMVVMAIGVMGIFITAILDKTVFYRHVTYILYLLRFCRGMTKIHSYALPLDKLKQHVPIERVHDGGLIEYSEKRYGILCKYDPPQISKTEYPAYHAQMAKIANAIPAGVEVSFHFYNKVDYANPLAETILSSMNTEGKTQAQKEHLHGMYEYATESELAQATPDYLISIKLGKFSTVKLAMLSYQFAVPGLLKSMRERGIYANQLIGENEIAIELRNFAIMEKYQ